MDALYSYCSTVKFMKVDVEETLKTSSTAFGFLKSLSRHLSLLFRCPFFGSTPSCITPLLLYQNRKEGLGSK